MQTLEAPIKRNGEFTLPLPKAPTERADRSDDPRWQLAQRIAASGSLGRSRLMAEFLLYVVDRHILDRGDEITEQQIGVLVFGRPDGYDSNEDNIVRSYARNLRKRLEEYFSGEGSHEPLRMEIPRGGYVPQFFNQLSEKASGLVESVEGSDSEEEYTLGGVSVLPNAEDIAETETRDNRSGLSSAGWFKNRKRSVSGTSLCLHSWWVCSLASEGRFSCPANCLRERTSRQLRQCRIRFGRSFSAKSKTRLSCRPMMD